MVVVIEDGAWNQSWPILRTHSSDFSEITQDISHRACWVHNRDSNGYAPLKNAQITGFWVMQCSVELDCFWNVMAHAQTPDFVFQRNGRVHLNRRGRQFSRLLAAEVRASAVVMLDTPCSEVVWRVLATYSIRQFHFHFPSRASLCAITFQLDYTAFFWEGGNGTAFCPKERVTCVPPKSG
jgi:hypothetical protein